MKRSAEIEIIDRKALGLGFQDLISDSLSGINILRNDGIEEKMKSCYNSAVFSEDNKKIIDAVYYYRGVVDIVEKYFMPLYKIRTQDITGEISGILLKSMNNLGVICYELNLYNEASDWFIRILSLDENNTMAKENLEILKSEKK